LDGDNFEVFNANFASIDEDLAYHIPQYEKIVFSVGKERDTRDLLNIIDNLKRRLNVYKLYSTIAI
jgi:hypothetical protein